MLHQSADRAAQTARTGGGRRRALWLSAAVCALLTSAGGCSVLPSWWGPPKKAGPPPPSGAVESMVLRDGGLESEAVPADGTPAGDLEGAKRLFHEKDYAKAEPIFHRLCKDKKNTVRLAEEALYYEAECERLQNAYPKAAELYLALLNSYPLGRHSAEARQRVYDIANYWLDDTREYMEVCKEKKAGKRWFVWPMSYLHFEKTKPTFDEEGHAMRMLEAVYITDPTGPLAEKALFYLGSVKFFREDYVEADHYFSQLVKHHPNGKMAPKALQLSIICKQMSTGGSEYDLRLVSEARDLVDVAYRTYPELANNQKEFLDGQIYSIAQQQADKDWKIAEFYRRTGHPGSAYFYYELVRRRYHGTDYEKKAIERMAELKTRADREHEKAAVQEGPPRANLTIETAPQPRTVMPGQPLTVPETGPAPRVLPPLNDDRRGP
jgi:outer membrane protein assembly factor BamD (BamD/ComL family)